MQRTALILAIAAAPGWPLGYEYTAEWRLITAGRVRMTWKAHPGETTAGEGGLEIQTAGMVGKLYPVRNDYRVRLGPNYCAAQVELMIQEGNRRRHTTARFGPRLAQFEERDLVKGTSTQSEIEIPACVHDVVGGLLALRQMPLEPGMRLTLPVSDGKRFAPVEVQVQARERIRTPAGVFNALRCEAFLLNGVVYQRHGRLFVWISEDEKRLPVQIQVRLQILIGTITLQLVKEES